ncbi:MAG: hypothetical protein GTO42_01590 [Candidatus Latescibacteria bacterium]|nr:hypothetical protein [Candidatus Latescibacterota bacterium]NIO27223.1 hypothetical protein [Candidatus Latescibacterota bacterium]NIO54747.1 hypothetical protein [Candidatus Latescibacterota bacterium]NIT00830.1 hypothetical protein [Candidatus Latescibacterota bacterium]NIT37753.1 hypothetical protein [Candidatus Latescibacterota bacterium]
MHEIGIAQSIIEKIEEKLQDVKVPITILNITVLLGKAANVNAESLQFGFDVAKEPSSIPFAKLVIEEEPVRLGCPHCHQSYTADVIELECRLCGKAPLNVLSGRDIQIIDIEYE